MPGKTLTFVAVLCGLLMTSVSVVAAELKTSLSEQRAHFVDARKALKVGQIRAYKRHKNLIKQYPLYGYLRYDYLTRRLHKKSNAELREFINTYADSPLSPRLQIKWMFNLAKRKQWKTFLAEYENLGVIGKKNIKLKCYRLNAKLRLKQDEGLMEEIQTLWMVGHSQPKSCNKVFDIWKARGGVTEELIWERIRLAMEKRKISLVKFLSRSLDKNDKKWVKYWLRMHRRPARMFSHKAFKKDTPLTRDILKHGIKRLVRRDVDAAVIQWEKIKDTHKYSTEEVAELDRHLALRAAYRSHPRASELLSTLAADEDVTIWRIRTALANQEWPDVLSWIEALPEEELQSNQWIYWRARALQEIGFGQSESAYLNMAEHNFSKIADRRSYYGFLAADRLKQSYDFQGESVEHREFELSEIIKIPGMTRAYELYRLGFIVEARREWQYALKNLDDRQLQLAAVLASRWGWHDRAILTVAKANHYSDLDIRFPMAFQNQVESSARRYRIDPAWVYGILRQESAFMSDARSSAGAMGLMQLMPTTARLTARLLKLPMRSNHELLNADKNIRLGSGYLKQMLDRYDGHQILATAAYNAGPHRVKKWVRNNNDIPADLWIEMIPFHETRNYVKNVMAFTTIFNKKLGGQIITLADRMPEISPPSP